jgi:hypothetical protein
MSFVALFSSPATVGAICIAAAFLFAPMLSALFGKKKPKVRRNFCTHCAECYCCYACGAGHGGLVLKCTQQEC